MERLQLVRRSRSKNDQRARCVRLTPAGRRLLAGIRASHARQTRRLFAGLSPGELARMQDLVTRLADHLQTLTPQKRRDLDGQPQAGPTKIREQI